MIYRKRHSLDLKGHVLPPKVIHRGVSDVTIDQGNHNVSSQYLQNPEIIFSQINVFHYPIRSLQQFISKVKNGGSGYSVNTHLPRASGFHKRYWYELLLKGQLESEYRRHFFDHQRLADALSSGDIIEDQTLSVFLQKES